MRIAVFAIIAVFGTVFLLVSPALAWGTNTHLLLGKEALDQASVLSTYLRTLLAANQFDFLYGSLFADMTVGKKFFLFAKFAHNWRIGMDLLKRAKTDHNIACVYGYLAHLAADTVAHNEYIPTKLVQHYDLIGRGHLFFETRFDAMLPDKDIHKLSKEVVAIASRDNDEFLEDSLNRTFFSFKTNRRIFRGVLTLQRNNGVRLYRLYRNNSKNHVTRAEVTKYMDRSLAAVMDLLKNMRSAECYGFDPHGKKAIKQAERLRSKLRDEHGSPELYREALQKVAVGIHRG